LELSLVLTALRRRWWLILLCTVVGGLVGSIYAPAGESNYESRTVLLVSPPADSALSAQSDPDRFVIGQLDILRLNTLADEVREAASDEVAGPSGGQLTTADVAGALTVSQVPKTDIVNLAIAWPDPESAKLLAQHYADTYLENLTGANEPEIEKLTEAQKLVEGELARINAVLVDNRTEWLRDHPGEGLPSLEVLDPVNAAERGYQQGKLERLQQAIDQLTYQQASGTQIVQDAGLPSAPFNTSRSLVPYGMVGGMLLGVAAAVVLANVSQVVEDDAGFEAILGVPPVGRISAPSLLAQGPDTPIDALPARLRRVIQEVCVRAEALAGDKHALSIAVVGSERDAGTAVIVGAMVRYFAGMAPMATGTAERGRATSQRGAKAVVTEAEIEDLLSSIVTVRDGVAIARLHMAPDRVRRDQVEPLVAAITRRYGVSVFDGGALLGSAATLRICDVADAIVLCVPAFNQDQRRLEAISAQLHEHSGKVLPLVVNPGRDVRRSMRADPSTQALSVQGRAASSAMAEIPIDDPRGAAQRT